MKTAQVEGQTVTIGDWVSFKFDIEQAGKIVDIRRSSWGVEFTLENPNGFEGGYIEGSIGGQTRTVVQASDCWVE